MVHEFRIKALACLMLPLLLAVIMPGIAGGSTLHLLAAAGAGSTGAQPPAQASVLSSYCANPNVFGANAIVSITSPWYCTSINNATIQIWKNWMPIAYAVMLLSFSIAAVLIMLGIALRSDRMRVFGIGELYEALATAIIVILFSFVAAELFGILPGFFAGSFNPYTVSLNYLSQSIHATGTTLTYLWQIATLDYFYAGQQVTECIGEVDFKCAERITVVSPIFKYGVIYGFFWPAWSLEDLMIGGFIAMNLEFYMIIFLMYAAIPVFLVPGVIFRAFMPTRHLGGMMMATAIGFYFFMPMLFSIAYYFTNTGVTSQLDAITNALGRYGGCTAGAASCSSAIKNSISPSSPLIETLASAPRVLSSFWLSTIFYPALISAMTYAFIVQVGEILGGMARSSSRLRGL